MKIEKNVVVWFTNMFNRLNEGGRMFIPNSNSVWEKRGNTVRMVIGNPMSKYNKRDSAHIKAAGFDIL